MSQNENPEPSFIQLQQHLDVTVPVKEKGFAISNSDWHCLRQRIIKIELPNNLFHTIGTVALGVAGSAFVSMLALPQNLLLYGAPAHLIYCIFTFLFIIIGVLSLIFNYKLKQAPQCTKEEALSEMDRIERRFRPGYTKEET